MGNFASASAVISRALARLLLVAPLLLQAGTSYTWTGSASALWSNPGNWNPAGVPQAGDSLIFEGVVPNVVVTNDLPIGTVFDSIAMDVPYVVNGNALGIEAFLKRGTFNVPVTVESDSVFLVDVSFNAGLAGGGHDFAINDGAVSGDLTGTGELTTYGNPFSRTYSFSGTLRPAEALANVAMPFATLRPWFASIDGTFARVTNDGGILRVSAGSVLNTGDFATTDAMAVSPGTPTAVVRATGAVQLGGSLYVDSAGEANLAAGNVYTLVDNTGLSAVSGTFRDLPEGASVFVGGIEFRVSYVGGDGNDVTLTCVRTSNDWRGAINGLWSNIGNWTNRLPLDGDVIRFPDAAGNHVMSNDLSGLVVRSLTFFGAFELNGNALGITASISGGAVLKAPLTIQADGVVLQSTTFAGSISGGAHDFAINGDVTGSLTGTGTIDFAGSLAGSHSFAGVLQLAGARFDNVSIPSASISNLAGATVAGTVGSVLNSGALAIAQGAGLPATLNTANFDNRGQLALVVQSPFPGTGYSQVNAHGIVSLAGNLTFISVDATSWTSGQVATIIANDGVDPVVGTFNGLPEGSVLGFGSTSFRISYVGGDGNDVTLTYIPPSVWTGAASALWSDDRNWTGGVPHDGSYLIFPAGQPNMATVNDLPGLALRYVSLDGPYSIDGAGFSESGGLSGSSAQINVPIAMRGGNLQARSFNGGIDVGSGRSFLSIIGVVNGNLSGSGAVLMCCRVSGSSPSFAGTVLFSPGGFLDDVYMPLANIGMGPFDSVSASGIVGSIDYGLGLLTVRRSDGPTRLLTGSLEAGKAESSGGLLLPLRGLFPGGSYSQIVATGAIDLDGGLTLLSESSFDPAPGDVLTLIRNIGTTPISGTFKGAPEGAILSVNNHDMRISYVGGLSGRDVTVTALNGKPRPSVSLASSANPAAAGSEVVFTITVSGPGSVPTGSVTIYDDIIAIGNAPLIGGVAQITETNLLLGSRTVTAEYSGGPGYSGALSNTIAQVVGPRPRLSNISTRMRVLTGNDVLIAGLIVGGTTPKTVVINVAGPSLANAGITDFLANPKLTLVRASDGAIIAVNDDWQAQSAGSVQAIQSSGFQPNDSREPAIIATLAPGAYTAIVEGAGGGTGVGLVGVFEVDHPESPLVNISTRGNVGVGNDVMIAGFIVQGTTPQSVIVNVAGPSLAGFGISNALANPALTVVRGQQVIAANDDWQNQAAEDVAAIQASGFQPNHPGEPAVRLTLEPGAYTVIVRGVNNTSGLALVGVFTQ